MRSDEREPLGRESDTDVTCEPVPPAEGRGAAPPPVERREVAPPPRRAPARGRRRAIWAILVAIVVIAAVAIAALALNGMQYRLPGTEEAGGVIDTPLAVNSPEDVNQSEANVSLAAMYPGQGQEDSHTFTRGESNTFQVVSTPVNGYNGRVLTKVFAEREPGGLGEGCIASNFGNNQSVNWIYSYVNGTHYGASDVGPIWQSDGSSVNREDVNLVFNRTGTYSVTFQSFDPDTGRAISQPLKITPLNVPQSGSMNVTIVGDGERVNINGKNYYAVQTNITNDWNLRRDVNSSDLRVYSKTMAVAPDPEATTFTTQSLDVGQSTQFTAYYDIPDDPTLMEYRDSESGQVIQIPLNQNATEPG